MTEYPRVGFLIRPLGRIGNRFRFLVEFHFLFLFFSLCYAVYKAFASDFSKTQNVDFSAIVCYDLHNALLCNCLERFKNAGKL